MRMAIKGIILDVDGVIVGEKIGFNSPSPHPDVIKKLREVRQRGTPISLCTAKPHFAIKSIIDSAGLNNFHIADGGGVIINPINHQVVEKHLIDPGVVREAVKILLEKNIYTEIYTVDDYFIQKDQTSNITCQHRHILQKAANLVDNLLTESKNFEVTKIMPIASDETDKVRVSEVFKPFEGKLTLSWGIHPVALPLQFGIVTAPGISKKQGAMAISKNQNIPLENMLGVGDSTSDWQFIELCQYGAAMGNASDELKKLVQSKDKNFSFTGPSVDENGILDILSHFVYGKN